MLLNCIKFYVSNRATHYIGHYSTILTDITEQSVLRSTAPSPSTILKEEFFKAPITEKVVQVAAEKVVQEAAKKAQLTIDDAQIWLEHLQTVLEKRK